MVYNRGIRRHTRSMVALTISSELFSFTAVEEVGNTETDSVVKDVVIDKSVVSTAIESVFVTSMKSPICEASQLNRTLTKLPGVNRPGVVFSDVYAVDFHPAQLVQ